MYLFFDTETSDLPRRWDAPVSDTSNWPRVVQLAWIACESAENATEPVVRLIQPEGFRIAPGAFQQHGISTEFARDNGVPLQPVLQEFAQAARGADSLVGHNVRFDVAVMGAEFLRDGKPNPLEGKTLRCTMRESTDFCRLPGKRGYKWPTLTQLHKTLFQSPFDGAHDAAGDTMACLRCFFRLRELKAIT